MSRNMVITAEAEVVAGVEPSERVRVPGGGDMALIDTQLHVTYERRADPRGNRRAV